MDAWAARDAAIAAGGDPNAIYGPGGVIGAYAPRSSYGAGYQNPLQDIVNRQQAEIERARAQRQEAWKGIQDRLQQFRSEYAADPMVQQSRALATRLMADPEAINDTVAQLIRNRAQNQLAAQYGTMERQGAGSLGESGQLDAASLAAMRERMGASRAGAMAGMTSNLEVQRAQQRNQDIMNAAQLGMAQAGQRAGLDLATAQTYAGAAPYEQADVAPYGAQLAAYSQLMGRYAPPTYQGQAQGQRNYAGNAGGGGGQAQYGYGAMMGGGAPFGIYQGFGMNPPQQQSSPRMDQSGWPVAYGQYGQTGRY